MDKASEQGPELNRSARKVLVITACVPGQSAAVLSEVHDVKILPLAAAVPRTAEGDLAGRRPVIASPRGHLA